MADKKEVQTENEQRPIVEHKIVLPQKYIDGFLNILYYTGDFTLSLLRQIPYFIIGLLTFIKVYIIKLFGVIASLLPKIAKPFSQLFFKIGRAARAIRIKSSAAYKSGGIKAMVKAFIRVLREGFARNREAVIKLRNYIFPVAGISVLLLTIFVFSQLTFGLIVEYDGMVIGSIKHEQIYDSAEKQLMQRVLHEEDDGIEIVPKFKLAVVNKKSFLTSDQVTDKLIEASSSVIDEASGLFVDGVLVGAVKDRAQLDMALDSILDKYRSDDPDEVIAFVKDVSVKDGLYPVSSIMALDKLKEKIEGESSAEIIYTVASGDTPYDVSRKAGISLDTFYALNPITKTTFVIGQKVTIASSEPFLSVKVQKYETRQQSVAYQTVTTKNNNYYTSYRQVTRRGVNGVNEVKYLVTYLNGIATEQEIVETKVISLPIDEKVTVGTKVAYNSGSTGQSGSIAGSSGNGRVPGFIWPTNGRISCRWWGYYNHRGLDIAAPRGTAIYAAAAGKVISVRYQNSGYGRHVVIDHGNGVQTLYAHASEIYVSVGQRVSQGTRIAAVGRTGWATGNHLHFGVMINGVYRNPELYLR